MRNSKNEPSNSAPRTARPRALRTVAACGALSLAAALSGVSAHATPGAGVIMEPISIGNLPAPIRAKFKEELGGFGDGTKVAQVAVVKFTVNPGGFFGWHQHGGPVWVVVAQGTLALYEGHDTSCSPHIQGPGSAFLDPGDHTHNARNEGTTPVVVYGTFLLPPNGAIRVDAPDPHVCTF